MDRAERRKIDYETLESLSSINSPSRPGHDKLTFARDVPMFPDTEMQLGMILRLNSDESAENVGGIKKSNVIIDQSQLTTLEHRLTVMQKRNVVLIAENKYLREQQQRQLTGESDKTRDIENECCGAEKVLDEVYASVKRYFQFPSVERDHLSQERDEMRKRTFEDRSVSTADFHDTMERGTQAWAVCRACDRKFEGQASDEDTAIITRSELEGLEKDMQALRDAVVTREAEWTRAMEIEQCYREQLTRSATEAMTARQLSETRYGELGRLAQSLAETEKDLRSAHKEISGLKKIIAKQENRQKLI